MATPDVQEFGSRIASAYRADGSPVVDFLTREGRSAASAVTRGAMGVLKGFMK